MIYTEGKEYSALSSTISTKLQDWHATVSNLSKILWREKLDFKTTKHVYTAKQQLSICLKNCQSSNTD